MEPNVDRYTVCPCGSGANAKFCCNRVSNHWKKTPGVILPGGAKTGISHPKCYFSHSCDCSPKISREHFISHGILKLMEKSGDSAVTGLPWLKDGQFTLVSPKSLVGRVLCERHNNALSPLDTAAICAKRTVGEFDADFCGDSPRAEVRLLAGEDLERWMLKTLCGLVAAKQLKHYESQPLQDWVSILYGVTPWPPGWGLYLHAVDFQHERHLRIETFRDQDHQINLVHFPVNNLGLCFAMPKSQNGFKSVQKLYRPSYIHFRNGTIRKSLILTWENSMDKSFVEFTRSGQTSEEAPGWPDYPTRSLASG